MCGISGWALRPGRNRDAGDLHLMATALDHRGPDDRGFFVDETASPGGGHRVDDTAGNASDWCDELGLREAMTRYFDRGQQGFSFPRAISIFRNTAWRLLLLELWSSKYLTSRRGRIAA